MDYIIKDSIVNIEIINVVVMLSSYNGEKYIEKQISSIISQEGVKVFLLVRDDGSNDGTPNILSELAKQYENIELLLERNVGVIESFSRLAKYAYEKYDIIDYFAFADQDDLWYSSKLFTACNVLKNFPNNVPNVFCSNSDLIDCKDKVIGKFKKYKPHYTRGNVVYYGTYQGCSMVFNKAALRDYVSYPSPKVLHDRWMYLICHFLGNTFYEHQPLFGYRIHGHNVVGVKVKDDSFVKDLHKLNRVNDNINKDVITVFLNCFGNRLSETDARNISDYLAYKTSLISKFKILFSPRFGPREISYRGIIGHFFRTIKNEL